MAKCLQQLATLQDFGWRVFLEITLDVIAVDEKINGLILQEFSLIPMQALYAEKL